MAVTTMVHVRVDQNIKTQATETLAAMREARVMGKARFDSAAALVDELEKGTKRQARLTATCV